MSAARKTPQRRVRSAPAQTRRAARSGKNKAAARRLDDPFLEREAERYEQPLPSREFILQTLTEQGVPLADADLAAALGVGEDELPAFERRLGAMERDGQVMRNRRGAVCVVDKLDLIRGRVVGHRDGFGFLVRDDGGSDLFLGPREMRKALHGDRVMARESGVDYRGRAEGKIVEVLEHANARLVGRLHHHHGILVAAAEDKRISQDFLIPPQYSLDASPGQVVMIEVVQQPSRDAQPVARVVEVLGEFAAPGMEIEIALRKHDLPYIFPREAERRASGFATEPTATDRRGRTDLTALPLVTIDGEDARDFDDAVYCEPLDAADAAFRLVVAIADVSHYVKPGDALDREALQRGNSVYFPRRVIPMLPEALSNGLCSLNPDVPRLAMVCDMRIDRGGEVVDYRFYPALMRSRARLTYTQVAEWLEHPAAASGQRDLLPHLQHLYKLFKALQRARTRRGAIDFETVETRMLFNDAGKIERIVPAVRNDAHRLIEECMLAANVCASDFLQRRGHPALYRIHEGPTAEKLANLRDFLKGFGLQLGGGEQPKAGDYANLLRRIQDRPDAQLLQTAMLRSLSQAIYSPDNVGHFGLAYESYTHFTSPIRRYPDLLIHRAIKAALHGRRYQAGDWAELGLHCSQTERRADEATRDVESWLKCFYMQDKIGDVFTGSVAAVVPFGLFVALDDIYVEGLVHVSDLGNDYFHYDKGKQMLLGERTATRFQLGDRVTVRVVRADLESSKIDFTLSDEAAGGRRKKAKA
ncbi:MAG TPA: ribonuclease R [Burkholderiales bacterium]|nr:ribonuclease R [Burkholderiales bacterium]